MRSPAEHSVRLVSSRKRTPTKAFSTAVDIPLKAQPLHPAIVVPFLTRQRPGTLCRKGTKARGSAGTLSRSLGERPAEQTAADVAAIDLARPVDLGGGGIGPAEGAGEIGGQCAHGEHPSAGAHQPAVHEAGAGMEDLDAGQGAGALEPADGLAVERPAGVAGARQHDAR